LHDRVAVEERIRADVTRRPGHCCRPQARFRHGRPGDLL